MTTQRLTAAAALHLGIPMTESIDQKAARLIALKAEAYYLQGRGKVEHALLAHAEFESALRTELAPAVQGEPVAWRQTGKYISDWRNC